VGPPSPTRMPRRCFEQRRDKLARRKLRQVSQIVFPNAEEAAAARTRLTSGLSFEDLAKERGSALPTSTSA